MDQWTFLLSLAWTCVFASPLWLPVPWIALFAYVVPLLLHVVVGGILEGLLLLSYVSDLEL